MTDGIVHIAGAGLAGLSAAVRLVQAGRRVVLHEANPFAGGRCRSFHDPRLDRVIDNGNHLILSGNRAARDYLALTGGLARMVEHPARFAFMDLEDGSRWTVAPNRGPVPWWIAAPSRRARGTSAGQYLAAWRLARAGAGATVAEAIPGRGAAWKRFWEPLTLAALNVSPDRASAALLWPVLRETFLRGELHCRPLLAPRGLGAALVEPAEAWLAARGEPIRFGRKLRRVDCAGARAVALVFQDGAEAVGPDDAVVLTLPPWRLRAVLPGVAGPEGSGDILNLFYRLITRPPAGTPPVTGVISGTADWIFLRGDVASINISAAGMRGLGSSGMEALTAVVWDETRRVLGLGGTAEPLATRVNWERRATFDQTPAGAARRPAARTALSNLYLAGDATDTGLPATIEGAIRSGETAARVLGQS
jgi:squalene-associated FAD-dependent desaturase